MGDLLRIDGHKSFRVKYKIGAKKYWRDVSATDSFDARLQILFKRGVQDGETWLHPDFVITEVTELPLDYVTKPRMFTMEEMITTLKENLEL